VTGAPVTWPPLVLAVAPNGARKTAEDHPALPITPKEIARTAASCREAGAAMIHLHVRDREGGHTLDVEAYRAATEAVRAAVGSRMIIQVTSEAVGIYHPLEQMAMVRELKPEAVSLAVREIIPYPAVEPDAGEFLAWLRRERIVPQYILYSEADLRQLENLIDRGLVPGEGYSVLFVLGRYSEGQKSEPSDLLPFMTANLRGHTWALCAFGALEAACAVFGAALGGHARVGFENNLYMPDGNLASDNAALVATVAAGAAAIGRPLADAEQARGLLGG